MYLPLSPSPQEEECRGYINRALPDPHLSAEMLSYWKAETQKTIQLINMNAAYYRIASATKSGVWLDS